MGSLQLPAGVGDGDWVTARLLAPGGDPEYPMPRDRKVEGLLTLVWAEPLRSWRATVAGQPVDPTSIQPAAPPGP